MQLLRTRNALKKLGYSLNTDGFHQQISQASGSFSLPIEKEDSIYIE